MKIKKKTVTCQCERWKYLVHLNKKKLISNLLEKREIQGLFRAVIMCGSLFYDNWLNLSHNFLFMGAVILVSEEDGIPYECILSNDAIQEQMATKQFSKLFKYF